MKRNSIRSLRLGWLMGLFVLISVAAAPAQSFALALAWGGQLETDIQAQGFFPADHTISVWFMGQYPGAYAGPMVASFPSTNTTRFAMGQGRFTASNAICRIPAGGGAPVKGETLLYVQLGNSYWDFQAPVLRTPGVWHNFMFIREGAKFRVYLDGVALSEETGKAQVIPGGFVPAGDLMMGDDEAPRRQYYGLLDELNIYTTPLNKTQIALLANRNPPGVAPGDVWIEEDFNGALPANWVMQPGCELVKTFWNNALDAQMLPVPNHTATFYVPFPAGEWWEVFQGQDNYQGNAGGDCGSHIGHASFCVDMRRVGPGFTKQSQSEGQEITASSYGVVDTVVDNNEVNPSNFIKVLSAPEEYISYMHFLKESNIMKTDDPCQPLDFIAKVGDVGSPGRMHLHHALSTKRKGSEGVTRPFAWSEYEYSQDDGATWTYAQRRMPQQGDWVRNLVTTLKKSGKLTMLRVNEVNLPFGSGDDKIVAEVIIQLENEFSRRAYGFQLRKDADEITRQGMLDQLRAAFIQDRTVSLTFRKVGQESFKQELINVELQ